MARTGVSYTEVANAATQLMGQGRNPTVEQVRLLLGTGSSTTIANHLRQWKTNQESTDLTAAKENIPAELVAVMKGLWERVINHSQEQVTAIENNTQQAIQELQQEVDKYKTNNQRWQKLYGQWIAEKNKMDTEKLTNEQALEFAHKENDTLHAKQDTLLQQLRDKQERIDELNRLHQQAQNNLEHYREAAREQRLLDQRQYEQQNQLLQSEIKAINDQLKTQLDKTSAAQQELHALQQTYALLDKNNIELRSKFELLQSEYDETEKAKNEYLQSLQHWQNQFKDTQNKLETTLAEFINTQAEVKVLVQQLADSKQLLRETQDQNKYLTSEKWELAQTKAQLEGQLKQMQKMITA